MTSRCLHVFLRRQLSTPPHGGRCGGGVGGAACVRSLSQPPPAAPPPSPALTPALTAKHPSACATAPPSPFRSHQQVRHATTRDSGAVLDEPRREVRFGLLKVFATVFAGLSVGAWVSQKMAAFLEENELFVPEDDDDDDD